jgi:aspartate/methionine/tyrosine aminotransferase
VPYPLIYDHGWQMDFHSLERAMTGRTRGVVVVHPNNPTGSYVHEAEIGPLNEFCRAHGLALIVDEVFLDYGVRSPEAVGKDLRSLHVRLDRHSSPQSIGRDDTAPSFVRNGEALTFTLSGLSKISALPQMKVAWVTTSGPETQVDAAMARLEVIADTYLSMNAPVQLAVTVMLEQRKDIQRQLLSRVRTNLAELDLQLAGQRACERLCMEGGWYVVLRVPVTRSDEELCIDLVRERSVLVHPGHFYDFDGDGYLVLSLIAEPGSFSNGCRRVLEHLKC